jgi:hypothetical protein
MTSAEDKIRTFNQRKIHGTVRYENVCAACGISLHGNFQNADQRVNGWPVCEPCFLET